MAVKRMVILVEGDSELAFIDSIEMLEKIGFETIYARCPRFSNWFDCLCSLIID